VKEQLVYLGIDIAKSYLDAAVGSEKRRFSNDTIGHRELITWIKQVKAPVQVICESSGGYERALVQGLARARVKISLVQVNRVRQFARAAGILAKTDRIDAEVLCEFGKVMQPQRVTAATLEQDHLRELESQRRHLTHLLVMEQNRGARVSDASVVRLDRSLINQIKKQIEKLDLLIKEHIEQSPGLSAKAEKLMSIKGVGLRTAALQPERVCGDTLPSQGCAKYVATSDLHASDISLRVRARASRSRQSFRYGLHTRASQKKDCFSLPASEA
jgi:transposase